MEPDSQKIEQYRIRLRSKVSYHLGKFCPDIEDVVQETLTRFLCALRQEKILNPEKTGAFLSGICNNVIQEYRRRLWRESKADAQWSGSKSPSTSESEMLELRDAVAAALAQMGERDCQVLRAFYLQEKEKEEICQSASLTDGQFRVTLFRAKDRFRKIYRQQLKQAASAGH